MFNELENEVRELNNKIISLSNDNKEIKELYKGCQIYFSPVRKNPGIMVIGINPGAGYFRYNNQISQLFEPPLENEKSEYIEELKLLFRKMDNQDLIERAFITNIYFFATNGDSDLRKLITLLPENIRIEFENKTKEWIKLFIKEIDPKIIFCMGAFSWDKLKAFYKENIEIIHEKGNIFEAKIENKTIIACSRSYNIIKNIDSVANKLKEYLK